MVRMRMGQEHGAEPRDPAVRADHPRAAKSVETASGALAIDQDRPVLPAQEYR
jgi:hypothetical protein